MNTDSIGKDNFPTIWNFYHLVSVFSQPYLSVPNRGCTIEGLLSKKRKRKREDRGSTKQQEQKSLRQKNEEKK